MLRKHVIGKYFFLVILISSFVLFDSGFLQLNQDNELRNFYSCHSLNDPEINGLDQEDFSESISRITQEEIEIFLISPPSGSYVRSTANITVGFAPLPSDIQWRWDSSGEWSNTSPTTTINISVPNSEGTHYVEVKAQNNDDQWFSKIWPFKVDDHRIFIILLKPQEYSTQKSGTPINIAFDPTPVSVLYSWDESPFSTLLRALPIGDGSHILRVQAESDIGEVFTDEFCFYTDDTPPNLVLSIENNSVIQSWTKGYFSVSGDTDSLTFFWDHPDNMTTINNNFSFHSFETPQTSGKHNLSCLINDTVDNSKWYNFTFIMTLRISLIYPFIQNYVDESCSDIHLQKTTGNISIQSNTLIKCNFSDTPHSVYYNWWENSTHQGVNTSFPTPAPISGLHILSIFANDSLGYWHTLTLDVEIDDSIPYIIAQLYQNNTAHIQGTELLFTISENLYYLGFFWDSDSTSSNQLIPESIGSHILELKLIDYANNSNNYVYQYFTKYNLSICPVNESSLKGNTLLNVTFNVSPEYVFYSWDGNPNTSYITPLPLISGYHALEIFTNDTEDNWYNYHYIYQTILEVNLTSPIPDYPTQSSSSITLSFSESPLTTLYSWDYTAWLGTLKPIPIDDGNHSFRVWVENNDLPNTQWFLYEYTIMVDNTSSEIISVTQENNSRINHLSEILFTFNEPVSVIYKWNDYPWVENTSIPTELEDGICTLLIRSEDRANNIAYYEYNYEFDNTPITITLISPTNNSFINSCYNRINITFSEDSNAIFYWISWLNMNMTHIPQLPFTNCSIIIVVYCFDGLNWNSAIFTFSVVHIVGSLSSVTPLNNSIIPAEQIISFNWTYTPHTLLWNWDDTENRTEQCISPSNDGNHSLVVYYQDISELWVTYQFNYTIDATSPFIIFADPLNGSTISKYVDKAKISFNEPVSKIIYRWSTESDYSTLLDNNSTSQMNITISIPLNASGGIELTLQVYDMVGNLGYIEYLVIRPIPTSFNIITRETIIISIFSFAIIGTLLIHYKNSRTKKTD